MPVLTAASGDQVDAVYRESHVLWSSGLDYEGYRGLWRDLTRTPWARRYAGFHAWVGDDGRLLSSVKLYRPQLRVCGRTARVTVIGALFTPSRLRGRGHASAMVEAELARARERGDRLALLFSDIGTEFYERFDFRRLPAVEQWGTLPAGSPPLRDWSLRPMTEGDLPAVAAAHDAFCRTRPLAVIRELRDGPIAGAVLNTFASGARELPADSELWRLPNVVITPRTAGPSGTQWHRVIPLFEDNLARFLAGAPMRNVVDKVLGYARSSP